MSLVSQPTEIKRLSIKHGLAHEPLERHSRADYRNDVRLCVVAAICRRMVAMTYKKIITERRLNELTNAIDDLTTLAQTPELAAVLRGQHIELVSNLRKLHDLVMDTEPTFQNFNNIISMVRDAR